MSSPQKHEVIIATSPASSLQRPVITQQLLNLGKALETSPSQYDNAEACRLMKEQRLLAKSGHPTHGQEYSYKDANRALAKVTQGHVTTANCGLVRALIAHGANVNIQRHQSKNLFKIVMMALCGRDNNVVRSNALQEATRHCSEEVLAALAQSGDDISLNQALPVAIEMGNAVKSYVLLQRGADASGLCALFLRAVDTGSDDLVEILLQSPKPKGPCQDCRDRGLVQAASRTHTNKAKMLLHHGANLFSGNGAAFRASLSSNSDDIAAAIISRREMESQPQLLDKAVAEAYSCQRINVVKLLIEKGARGPGTDQVYAEAMKHQDLDLVTCIARYGSSSASQCHIDIALKSALQACRLDLVEELLRTKPSQTSMAAALPEVHKIAKPRQAGRALHLFLSAGLRGDAVSSALVDMLRRQMLKEDEAVRGETLQMLLVSGKADVNFQSGRPLSQAIESSRPDLLAVLLTHRPALASLAAALSKAISLTSADARKQFVHQIMMSETRDDAGTAILAHSDERLVQRAMEMSAGYLHYDILELLSTFCNLSPNCLQAAFAAISSKKGNWEMPEVLRIAHFLLKRGVNGPNVHEAFCQVTALMNGEAMRLLSPSISRSPDGDAIGDAMLRLIECSSEWQSSQNMWVVKTLLDYGCRGPPVNIALIKATASYGRVKDSDDGLDILIDLLLSYGAGADVNYRNAEVLRNAARFGNAALMKKLVAYGAASGSLREAFTEAISSNSDENAIMSTIAVLVEYSKTNAEAALDINANYTNRQPLLVTCLSSHPKSSKLVRYLISLGCDVEARFGAEVRQQDSPVGMEQVTLLCWALSPLWLGETVSPNVIGSIIAAGRGLCMQLDVNFFRLLSNDNLLANVNFETPSSRTTPLILAAQCGREDIVRILLNAKANPLARDHLSKTALFYASSQGFLGCVKALVEAKSDVNDGSLHEAARNLHHGVVAVLMRFKHDVNFPSSRFHEGRKVIQELASKCDARGREDELDRTLRALSQGPLDIMHKYKNERNALFLALENARPLEVTKGLLERVMYQHVNNEKNVFVLRDAKTGTQYFFSATVYLKKNLYRGDPALVQSILDVLSSIGCQDRYYAEFGPGEVGRLQPVDAEGMPAHLRDENRRRMMRMEKHQIEDEEHRRARKRENEVHSQREALKAQSEHNVLHLRDYAHRQKLQHGAQSAQQNLTIDDATYQQRSAQQVAQHQQRVHESHQTFHQRQMQSAQASQQKMSEDERSARFRAAQQAAQHQQRVHESHQIFHQRQMQSAQASQQKLYEDKAAASFRAAQQDTSHAQRMRQQMTEGRQKELIADRMHDQKRKQTLQLNSDQIRMKRERQRLGY